MSIKINPNSITTRILKNKRVLKTLENISEHGTSFSAGTALLMSLTVRPAAIASTPDTEKENKQYAIANSIGSGLMKFAMVEAVAIPVENAVKNIDTNAGKFLKVSTIEKLGKNSKSYNLITQVIKLGTGFLTAVPKSVLTIALIPVIMDNLFFRKKRKQQSQAAKQSAQAAPAGKNIPFSGMTEKISRGIAKIIDNETVQKFAIKNQDKDKDIAKHITAATDILLTTTSVCRTNASDKIKENRKKALIYNNIISTAITLIFGYGIDNILKKSMGNFIEKFKQINAADPKLHKYIEGINIVRPAVIFAAIYYGILPMFSTYMAEKIDKFIEKK